VRVLLGIALTVLIVIFGPVVMAFATLWMKERHR
jgi:hypothetical protein